MNRLQAQGVAPSTRRTYNAGTSAFSEFCGKRGIPLLPASELTLRYFCTYLSKRVSYRTIKVYLAGIRLLHLEHGFEDPTRDAPLLTYLCIGIRRSNRKPTKTRLPITISLLHTIKQQLSTADIPTHDKLLYWVALTLAFYGFLWASEYSCPTRRKYKSSTHLLLEDITTNRRSLSARLKRSKTDRFGKSATVLIGATGSCTCPVRAMGKFLAARWLQPPGPLFMLKSGDFLTRTDISRTTKHLLHAAGIDPEPYSSHSYRIGAATAAADAGLPDHLIKTLGRWRSNAYQTYIRTSSSVLRNTARQITQAQ